jgi:Fe-S-cluster containining protein
MRLTRKVADKGGGRMGICDSCHGGCCRAFAVPVTGADIIAIRRKLGLPFEEFVRRTPDPSGRISNGAVPHFSFNDSPDTPYVICLTHAPSVFHARSTKCRFLIESQPDEEFPLGRARCGIYGVRPSACRVFPTKFNATNDLAIVCDIPDRFRDNTNPAYTLCPRPWAPEDVDPIQAVQDLAVVTYELAFFRQVAELWNRAPASWSVFPQFLDIVYAKRVGREVPAETTEDEGPVTLPFRKPSERRALRSAA